MEGMFEVRMIESYVKSELITFEEKGRERLQRELKCVRLNREIARKFNLFPL